MARHDDLLSFSSYVLHAIMMPIEFDKEKPRHVTNWELIREKNGMRYIELYIYSVKLIGEFHACSESTNFSPWKHK